MSLDLDPTEQQLAAALGRLAEAYVPEAGEPPAPSQRPGHRRWLAVAVAASLVVLVAGIWAVTDRPADPAVVTVPPTPVPSPTSAPPPAVTSVEPLAIIDPAVAPGEPTTRGAIDRHLLRVDQFASRSAVRRAPDGTVESTLIMSLSATGQQFGPSGLRVAGRPALRTVAEDVGRVVYFIEAGELTLTVTTELAGEDDAIAWLERVLENGSATPDITALPVPSGFEPMPAAEFTEEVRYVDGESSVGVQTTRFAGPIDLSDWLAVETPGASTAGSEVFTVSTDQGLRYLIWQPQPDVLVTVGGTGDPTLWRDALEMSTVAAVQPVPVSERAVLPGAAASVDERTLDRIVLGETTVGRFVYIERSDDRDGDCWTLNHELFGGFNACALTGTSAVQGQRAAQHCGLATAPDGVYRFALVIDRPDAVVEFGTEFEIERGVTPDGTPFVVAWVRSDVAPPASELGVTVDGDTCLSPG
jgi:hypothetical protein